MKLSTTSRALALFLAGGLFGAAMFSPVMAAPSVVTKKFVRQVAKKKANKVQANLDTHVADANAKFQGKAEVLFGTIDKAGTVNATLKSGRGITGVAGFVATIVTFNRNVSNCTATATYGGAPNDDLFAEVEYDSGNTARLNVWTIDVDGNLTVADDLVHVMVLCP